MLDEKHTTNAAAFGDEGETLSAADVDEFIQALRISKRELEIAQQQFENVLDPRLIDHVVFRLGAAERHFSYLLQLARQMKISSHGVRWDRIDDNS